MSSPVPTNLTEDTAPGDNPVQSSMAYDIAPSASPASSDQVNQFAAEQTTNNTNLATNSQSQESGKQLLADLGDGNVVAIPVRNPIATVSAPGTLQSQATNLANQNSNSTQLAAQQTIEPGKSAGDIYSGGKYLVGTSPSKSENSEKTKKMRFLARLLQRSRKNFNGNKSPTDDRKSPILLSSRTASMSNRVTPNPPTGNLASVPGNSSTGMPLATSQGNNIQIASAAGVMRQPLPKLKTQHSGVDVSCILPDVMQLVKVVERRYGKVPVVTSGYRSPSRNRRAGGARNSMHIYCKAVDIQVEGVSKWDLAKFLRTVPGRGGVGTYCNTRSVHIDTGPKRDWHYSCRRKSKLRRKA